MTLGEFRKYLFGGKITFNRSNVTNVIIESRNYIPELKLKPGNFAVKNPLYLEGDILNREVVCIKAYNSQVVIVIK